MPFVRFSSLKAGAASSYLGAALFLLAFAFECAAGSWIVASVASHHFDDARPRDYEQRNWGLGFEHELTRTVRATAGFYRNSIRNESLYVGAVWAPISFGVARLGLAAELVSGYETAKSREPVKALFPVLAFEWRTFGLNIPFVPPTDSNVGAVALQVKVRW